MSYKLLTNLLFEPRGKHNPSLTYNIKDTVMSEDGSKVYFALDNVPAGIPLTDTNYWMLQMDLSASKNAMDVAVANARTQTDATIASANTRVEDMMGKAAEAVTSVADYAAKVGMRVKGETKITKGNPMTIYPDGGSLLKVQTDIPIKQLGEGDPYPAGGGKNLLPTGTAQTINGVTFTPNADGSISAKGTATGNVFYGANGLWNALNVEGGTEYILSGTPATAPTSVYLAIVGGVMCKHGVEVAFSYTENTPVQVVIVIESGNTVDYVFYPMIRLASGTDSTYTPYSNIRPFIGYDKLNLNHAGKNLIGGWVQGAVNSKGEEFSSSTVIRSAITKVGKKNVFVTVPDGLGYFLVEYAEGTFLSRTDRNASQAFILRDNTTHIRLCLVKNNGSAITPSEAVGYQVEYGTVGTEVVPYQGKLYTVQLGKTTYQGHYDWLTGKFRAEWKGMRLLSSYVSTSMKYVPGYVGAWMDKVLVNDHSEGPETILCSHLLGRNVYNWSRDGVYVQGENTIGIQFSGSSIPGYTDTGNADQNAGLVRAYLDANDVQIVYKLATPIEMQLAPNVITAIDDGGMNYIYGDADLTVEWVKPLETSLTEHGNAKVDANNEALLTDVAQKERSIGNPVVINDAVANVAFAGVETVFTPKQTGSGDPYPAGAGKNLCDGNAFEIGDMVSGSVVYTAGNYVSGYIAVKPNTTYTRSSNCLEGDREIAFFDANKNYIDRAWGSLFTTPSNCYYVRLEWEPTYPFEDSWFQLEEGSTPTEYAPYSNIRPIIGYDKLDLNHAGKNLCDISPFLSSWATENADMLSLINTLSPGTYTVSVVFEMQNPERASATDKYGLLFYPYEYRVLAEWGSVAVGTTRRMTFTFNVTANNAGKFTTAYFYGCGDDGIGQTGYATVKDVQLEINTTATTYEPYQCTLHTVQLGETVYGGHYNWLTGKLTKNVGNITLDGSQGVVSSWFGNHGNILVAYSVPDALTIPPTVKSNLLISDKLKTEIGDDQHQFVSRTNSISMSGSSGCIVVCIRGITTLSDMHTWLSQNPVECVYPLATPIEIQLDPSRITTIPGTNTIFGDGEFTIDWFKSYKKVAEERENLLLDSFTDKAELSGNPIVMTPVGGLPFDSVVTEFAPKQAGSGDPYPAGGGRNLCPYMLHNEVCALRLLAGRSYVVSISDESAIDITLLLYNDGTGASYFRSVPINIVKDGRRYGTFTLDRDTTHINYTWGATADLIEPQIEEGSTPTEYAPYSNIRPITGYDKLDLNQVGKNMVPWPYQMGGFGTVYKSNGLTAIVNDDYSITVNGTATGSVYLRIGIMNLGSETIIPGGTNGVYALSDRVRYNANSGMVSINFADGNVLDNHTFYPQIELGTAATQYETPRRTLHTVKIGQTVYGGKLDWLTGKMVAEWTMVELDGTETFVGYASGNARLPMFTPKLAPATHSGICSNVLKSAYSYEEIVGTANTVAATQNAIVLHFDGIQGTDNTIFTDVAAKVAALKDAGTPVQVAYKLATPIEIQLTPSEIIALTGVNTLYGDGDTITAKFRQSKDVDILKRLSALETLMINQTKGE